MLDQLDLFPVRKARESRDRALKRVESNNQGWLAEALRYCEASPALRAMREFSGEDLRIAIAPHVGQPRSPHAWGLVTRYLMQRGVIIPSGRWVHMRSPSSHARKTASYFWSSHVTE